MLAETGRCSNRGRKQPEDRSASAAAKKWTVIDGNIAVEGDAAEDVDGTEDDDANRKKMEVWSCRPPRHSSPVHCPRRSRRSGRPVGQRHSWHI